MSDEIWTVREVAQYLKLSRTTVWRWCNEGKLPGFKVGRGWRVHRAAVERMVENKVEIELDKKEGNQIGETRLAA